MILTERNTSLGGAHSAAVSLFSQDVPPTCGECAKVVTSEISNPYEYGLSKNKAAYLPHAMAYPQRYVLDASIVGTPEGEKAKAACKYNAIDLDMKAETVELKVGSVVWATGWKPYDAAKIQPYGYDRFDNVITSLEFDRVGL